MKKLFSIFTILFIFIPAMFLVQPRTSYALDGGAGWVNVAKEYGLDTLVTIIQSRIIDKIVKDTYNWAAGGFDGDPGFVDNWDGFLKGTQYDVISSSFGLATTTMDELLDGVDSGVGQQCGPQPLPCNDQYENDFLACISGLVEPDDHDEIIACEQIRDEAAFVHGLCIDQHAQWNACMGQGGGSGAGGQAQNNYNLWVSGALDSARNVANTIARTGSQQLNANQMKSLIQGEGETLSTLLGSKEAKEAFKTDFSVGGWMGYIALIDPHNTDAGLQGLVGNTLSGDVTSAVTKSIQDIQTENKFLNRTLCEETTVGSDGEEVCTRQRTTTPGNLVASKIFDSSNTDISRSLQAEEFSDVLAKAIGAIGRQLLQAGIAGLVDGGVGSSSSGGGGFFPVIEGTPFNSDYQSSYDVLGLSFGTGTSGGSGTGPGSGTNDGGGNSAGPNPFGDVGSDGSLPFIGGPEDAGSGAWDGPELIIDLQQVLERAITNTRQELANYVEVERLLRENADNIISLDRCVPGPGIGWEDRMRDVADVDSDDESERRTLKRMNVSDTKRAVSDPLINIPGAQRIKSLVDSMLESENISQANQISFNRQQKTNTYGVLINIESSIRIDFNEYREEFHSQYPLFKADWEKLSQQQKLEILSLRYDENGDITSEPFPYEGEVLEPDESGFSSDIVVGPQYLINPYYLFKPGETPETLLAENEEAAMNAVLSFAWNLWQQKKGEEPATEDTPSGTKQKSNIRYRYYIMENNISTEADVLKSSLKIDETIENNKVIKDFLDDCIQLRHFVTGYDKELIAAALLNPFMNVSTPFGGTGTMSSLPLQTIHNWHGRSVRALVIDNAKNDSEIKNYLIQQRALQDQGLDSDFKTDLITGEGSIESSILGFNSEEEKLEYFEDFYAFETDGDLEEWQFSESQLSSSFFTRNATSIAEILQKDYSISNWPRGGNGRGTLFCRLETNFDSRGQGGRQSLSDCAKDWYTTSNVEYRSRMSGV